MRVCGGWVVYVRVWGGGICEGVWGVGVYVRVWEWVGMCEGV